jgi:threonine dehydratase
VNEHDPVSRSGIASAERVIRPYIRKTPVITVDGADFGVDADVSLKLELFQRSGSFKARGAFANLLLRQVPLAGVVAASGGNHGVAVAYAAMTLGIPAKVFIPDISSPAKIERIRTYRADLVIGGDRYADALAACGSWAAESGALEIHAFDQVETLRGAGTVGLEFERQVPTLDTLLVPVGGGGLIGGIATWFGGTVQVVGVEPEGAPTLSDALRAGRPVDAATDTIAADSLAPRRIGDLVFPIARRYVPRAVLVTDDAIRRAQHMLWDVLRVVAEPGGATALAALTAGLYRPAAGERVGVVVSGGNTDVVAFDPVELGERLPGDGGLTR